MNLLIISTRMKIKGLFALGKPDHLKNNLNYPECGKAVAQQVLNLLNQK